MQDYKPNSHKYREEQNQEAATEKRVQKVVQGTARPKKKNGLAKVADVFISEDVHNLKEYWVQDLLVPTLKKAALTTLDMILNGGDQKYTGGRSGSHTSKVSYGRYYDDPRDDNRARPSSRGAAQSRADFGDIEFATRGDAETVLDELRNVLRRYPVVTVADMYDLAGLTEPYTSNKFGWTNLNDAGVVRRNGAYYLDLPKALPLD